MYYNICLYELAWVIDPRQWFAGPNHYIFSFGIAKNSEKYLPAMPKIWKKLSSVKAH
jgi:hypothetical protein